MADTRFIDFDAARKERRREPLILQAYGERFELPAALPAALFLDVLRLDAERSGSAEINGQDALELMQRVLPIDVLDALLERDDFSLEDLVDLAELVMQAYTEKGEVPGESAAPNRATRRHPPAASARSRGSRAGSSGPKSRVSPGTGSSSTGS
jgi:aminoglycoside phosphotransferase family enzyme